MTGIRSGLAPFDNTVSDRRRGSASAAAATAPLLGAVGAARNGGAAAASGGRRGRRQSSKRRLSLAHRTKLCGYDSNLSANTSAPRRESKTGGGGFLIRTKHDCQHHISCDKEA